MAERLITIETIVLDLGLPEDASDRDIRDRIAGLREDAGEDVNDLSDRELIRRGAHEHVAITPQGATVSLYTPVKSGSEWITELNIRRPKAKEIRKITEGKGGSVAQTLALLAILTGRAPGEIDELDQADANLCGHVIGFLQQPPRRTGSSS